LWERNLKNVQRHQKTRKEREPSDIVNGEKKEDLYLWGEQPGHTRRKNRITGKRKVNMRRPGKK